MDLIKAWVTKSEKEMKTKCNEEDEGMMEKQTQRERNISRKREESGFISHF